MNRRAPELPMMTRRLLPIALLAIAACGGSNDRAQLAWDQSAITVAGAGTATVTLTASAQNGAYPPGGEWLAFVYQTGGGPSAPAPAGHCSLATTTPCETRPRPPLAVTISGCAKGTCSATVTFTGAGAGALAGTWTFKAVGPSQVEESAILTVTQTP